MAHHQTVALILSPALTLLSAAAEPEAGTRFSLSDVLFPALNVQSAFGTSTAEPADLASGHHDPDRHGFTVQDIEFSLGVKYGALGLFGTYAVKIDQEDRWKGNIEEYYATVSSLPLQSTLKGGRFYTRFGFQNQKHPHDFTMVDQFIANGRLLGEDSLTVQGGEISLPILRDLPTGWEDRLTFSYGQIPAAEEEEHGHEEAEPTYESEAAFFSEWAATADYTLTFAATSATLHTGGVSAAWGDNHFGRSTQVYGAHYEYLWRAEGALRADGHAHRETSELLRWRSEAMLRSFGAVAEGTGKRREFTDFAAYSVLTYGLPGGKWQAHLRAEYASGTAEAGLPERWRLSPAATWSPDLPLNVKLQYNYDHSPSFGDEHSVWLQFNLQWGDGYCAEH